MNGTSDMIEKDGAFIEEHCTIEHEGHSFTSGGGWLCKRVDTGKYGGILYAYLSEHEQEKRPGYKTGSDIHNDSRWRDMVGSWDGSIKIPAHFGYSWYNNFGDKRQSVYFTHEIDGVKHYFYGVYYKSGSDIVRVREMNPWQ